MARLFCTVSMVFCLAVACLGAPARAGQPLTLATINNFTSKVNGIVLHEVYRRAGIQLDIVAMPPSRVTAMSTSGGVDGEVNRIRAYGALHPTLVRVEPPINYWTVSAFYKNGAGFEIRRAADLGERPVGIVRGIKATADLTAGNPKVSVAPSSRELMLMLINDRFDVAIDGAGESGFYVRKLGLQGITSVELEQHALYHYLHEKHQNLVPLISREIRKMADSGELKRVFDKAVNDVMESGLDP